MMKILQYLSLAAALTTVGTVSALAQVPNAPAPAAASPNADPFPPVDQRFFDAPSPSLETVNGFLKSIWGYDSNRIWRVEGIQKTSAAGVTKVLVYVADKSQGSKVQPTQFFVTPDGRHAIADTVFDFGAKPFAEKRVLFQERADGPARGSKSKDLLLVEFADLQCPHCKDGQPIIEKLLHDFPQARIVFQNFPLTEIHPYAYRAAAYGSCVAAKSNDAFFVYVQDVFNHQEALNPEIGDKTLANAVTAAGQDPTAVATCAASPATKEKIDAQIKLANDAGVDQTPMIAVNGHLLPLESLPYETLKQIIAFQAQQDGVSLTAK